uniref:hypothetical protein n=1 Tax=Herbidospora sakaeratensis TaxID=564415 RepID=UPI000B13352E|nr:hypothetical protein [Herbidospora sakaeratensis]
MFVFHASVALVTVLVGVVVADRRGYPEAAANLLKILLVVGVIWMIAVAGERP